MSVFYIPAPFSEARAIIEKKMPDRARTIVTADSYTLEAIEQLLLSPNLFAAPVIVCVDVLSKDTIAWSKPLVLRSTHDIFFVESADFKYKHDFITSVKGETLAVKQKASKSFTAKPKSFAFDVAFAVLAKDKKTAWLAYHRALQNGEAPEAIHGALWWAIKNVAQVAGVKKIPAALNRFARFQNAYTPHSARTLADMWIGVLHNARIQNSDFRLAFEKALLEL